MTNSEALARVRSLAHVDLSADVTSFRLAALNLDRDDIVDMLGVAISAEVSHEMAIVLTAHEGRSYRLLVRFDPVGYTVEGIQ